MKHLKLFENHQEEPLYQLLGPYSREYFKNCIDIRPETLRELTKWGIKWSKTISGGHKVGNKGKKDGEFQYIFIAGNSWDFIVEMEDEWYLVCFGKNVYKCDQLDGLQQFLLDKGIITPSLFTESFKEEDYYNRITSEEYMETKCIPFDISELQTLKSLKLKEGLGIFYLCLDYEPFYKTPDEFKYNKVHYVGLKPISGDESITDYSISKTNDEWFYVRIYWVSQFGGSHYDYFKCDQMEGVLKLLKDEFAID
jgi:hypothetical protein